MKRTMCVVFSMCSFAVSAGTVQVETVQADEVRTKEISVLPDAPTDAILYYAFAENTGSLVVDSRPNGYNAMALGCTWMPWGWWSDDGSMEFFGDDSKIPAYGAPNFPKFEQYTVSIKFCFYYHWNGSDVDFSNGLKLVDKTNGDYEWYLTSTFPLDETGLIFHMSDPSGNVTMTNNFPSWKGGRWTHAVVVRDGVNGQLWVDGALVDSTSAMFSMDTFASLCLGNSLSSDPLHQKGWHGNIDDFMIFDRALSAAEIISLYESGTLTHDPLPPSPISVTSDLAVGGNLTVTGETAFEGGIRHVRPLGDLSSGVYTNAP